MLNAADLRSTRSLEKSLRQRFSNDFTAGQHSVEQRWDIFVVKKTLTRPVYNESVNSMNAQNIYALRYLTSIVGHFVYEEYDENECFVITADCWCTL